eukprot:PhM_4_TR18511/c0_g1_i1/m.5587/K07176/K07176; putative serine/threonine protein kinase
MSSSQDSPSPQQQQPSPATDDQHRASRQRKRDLNIRQGYHDIDEHMSDDAERRHVIAELAIKEIDPLVLEEVTRQLTTDNNKELVFFARGRRGVIFQTQLNHHHHHQLFVLCAVKIRKSSAPADALENEQKALERANSVGVGPMIVGGSFSFNNNNNVIVTEWAQGVPLAAFLDSVPPRESALAVVFEIIDQAAALDRCGLVKSEMTHQQKHIFVDPTTLKVTLIDFDRCKFLPHTRQNVTQTVQYLSQRRMSSLLSGCGMSIDVSMLRQSCAAYKRGHDDDIPDVLTQIKKSFTVSSSS